MAIAEIVQRLRLTAVTRNISIHWNRFLLSTLNPLAPADQVIKLLLKANRK